MNLAQFRLDLPEFADAVRFPDSMLTFWATIGEAQISANSFGNLYNQAVELFTAHNLILAKGNAAGTGGSGGAVASKKVGSVSVSYDNASSMVLNAGHWNQTVYGRQYIQLARLIGTVAYQL
jgi:hypothetical protein